MYPFWFLFSFYFLSAFWYVFFLFSGSWFLVRNSRFLVPSASSKRKHPFHVIRLTRPLGRPPPCRGSVTWALFVSVLVPVLFMAAFVLLSNFLKPEFACGYAVSAYVFLIFFLSLRENYTLLSWDFTVIRTEDLLGGVEPPVSAF